MPRPPDRPPRPFRRAIAAAVATAAAGLLGAAASNPDAFDRLRSLPLRQRRALAENLERFDRLDADERAAIRAVDRRVAELEPEERARAFDRLRRYRLWVQSLPESRRDELLRATPESRIEAVKEFLREERSARPDVAGSVASRSLVLNPGTLTDTAFQVRVWRALKPEDRDAIVLIAAPEPRHQEIVKRGRALGLLPEPTFFKESIGVVRGRLIDPERSKAFFDEFRDEIAANARANPQQKGKDIDAFLALLSDPAIRDAILNPMANLAPLKALPADKRDRLLANGNRLRMRFNQKIIRQAEAEHLATNRLEPVEPAQLRLFLATLPPWIEQGLAALPADEARLKVTALYRLVEAAKDIPPRRPPGAGRPRLARPPAGPKPS